MIFPYSIRNNYIKNHHKWKISLLGWEHLSNLLIFVMPSYHYSTLGCCTPSARNLGSISLLLDHPCIMNSIKIENCSLCKGGCTRGFNPNFNYWILAKFEVKNLLLFAGMYQRAMCKHLLMQPICSHLSRLQIHWKNNNVKHHQASILGHMLGLLFLKREPNV